MVACAAGKPLAPPARVLHHPQSDAGFTLIEMLIAAAMMLTITAAVFTLVNPAHGVFRAQPEASDMQQRLRVATELLSKDLRLAGAGMAVGPVTGPLIDYFAPILPYRAGDVDDDAAAGVHFRPEAVTVLSIPPPVALATLGDGVTSTGRTLSVTPQPTCLPPTAANVCGFEAGVRAMVFTETGAHDVMTVTDVLNPALQVQYAGSLRRPYPPGTAVTQVQTRTYYFKPATAQLMRYDGYRSDLPVIDNVVSLQFRYFGDPKPPALLSEPSSEQRGLTTYGPGPPAVGSDDPEDSWPPGENCVFTVQDGHHEPRLPVLAAGMTVVSLSPGQLTDGPWCIDAADAKRFDADLLRIRRVTVTLRVQAGLAMLRGPAGALFARGGTATSAERLVPDLEIAFDIAPRNMRARR